MVGKSDPVALSQRLDDLRMFGSNALQHQPLRLARQHQPADDRFQHAVGFRQRPVSGRVHHQLVELIVEFGGLFRRTRLPDARIDHLHAFKGFDR